MKDLATLLATVLVLLSLIGLLVADYNRDSTSSGFVDDDESISDVRDRLALKNR